MSHALPITGLPAGLKELAELEQARTHDSGLAKLWASGVPLNAKSPLLDAHNKVDDGIKSLRQDAATKWTAMQDAQKAVTEAIAAGTEVTPESDLFVKLDEAGKSYGDLQDKIISQERVKGALVVQMGQEGLTPGDDGGSTDDYMAELRSMAANGGFFPQRKSAGQQLTESAEYKALLERKAIGDEVPHWSGRLKLGKSLERDEVKAALQTGLADSSGGALITPQQAGFFGLPQRPITLLDLITVGTTDTDLIEFVRQVSRTNNAGMVAEATSAAVIGAGGGEVTALAGGRKPVSELTLERVQATVRQLAHIMYATNRALSDAGQLRTLIDSELAWGLNDLLEREILLGDGSGEHLSGILETTGIIPVGASAKSHADKIHNASTLIRIQGYLATGVVMNPLDAESMWLTRENGSTGAYLFGGPAQLGQRTIWGMPVAETPVCPQGTALVGNMASAILWMREGVQIVATDSNRDLFERNIVTVRGESRAAFGVPRPKAFAEVNLAAS